MSIDQVIHMYSGFHHEGEIRMLNRIAAGVTDGCIVAIGSYRGQMDCALALHAQVPVYAIDDRGGSVGEDFPFGDEDRTHWMRNVLTMGLGAKIRPINLLSEQAALVWDKPIGLLFIDGSHDYESVTTDLKNWLEFVVSGGLVAFHDVTNPDTPGVARAIAEYADCLELVEEADLTQVYRFSPPRMPTVSFDEAEPEMAHNEMDESAFEHVTIKAAPRHPSQKPKTATKKKGKTT
jgi:hypothetical protein